MYFIPRYFVSDPYPKLHLFLNRKSLELIMQETPQYNVPNLTFDVYDFRKV